MLTAIFTWGNRFCLIYGFTYGLGLQREMRTAMGNPLTYPVVPEATSSCASAVSEPSSGLEGNTVAILDDIAIAQ